MILYDKVCYRGYDSNGVKQELILNTYLNDKGDEVFVLEKLVSDKYVKLPKLYTKCDEVREVANDMGLFKCNPFHIITMYRNDKVKNKHRKEL